MEDRRSVRQHPAVMSRLPYRPAALLALGLLSLLVGACGDVKRTPTASKAKGRSAQAAAVTGESVRRSTDSLHGEGVKPDVDHDTDGNAPDADEIKTPDPKDGDEDYDSTGKHRYDKDDGQALRFGHAADRSDRRIISALVRVYYATASREDGAAACSMLYSTFAESVPEDYGTSPPGPAYARGATCAAVLTAVFKHFHGQLASRLPMLKVAQVRLVEHHGRAVLTFGKLPPHEMSVRREGRVWKIEGLLDSPLP